MNAASYVLATYSTKWITYQYCVCLAATADVLALAKIEVNLTNIPEGETQTIKWRGKPLFVRNRSAEDIAAVRAVPLATLRDPQSDEVIFQVTHIKVYRILK